MDKIEGEKNRNKNLSCAPKVSFENDIGGGEGEEEKVVGDENDGESDDNRI